MLSEFDVLIVGGGHAAIEAAWAACKRVKRVAMITFSATGIGKLSCNPSIGGVGKGHLVKEITAMGGLMGRIADTTGLHFKRLNQSKGSAVRATRIQVDADRYPETAQAYLNALSNLSIFSGEVNALIFKNQRVIGVKINGNSVFAKSVVLCNGTFLNGMLHIGLKTSPGGRLGEKGSNILADQIKDVSVSLGRLKTGTPPRLDGKTICWDKLLTQESDDPVPHFYFSMQYLEKNFLERKACYLTKTNERSHEILKRNFHLSPLMSGKITGIGPRYCPSIEDKIFRFPERTSHQIFLEPETSAGDSIYPNGISTSLPLDVQIDFLRSIEGLEKVEILKPGYAVEYDFCDPRYLLSSLEHREIRGLFFAGQVNGTTGYEEAAAQGLLAGINASNCALEEPSWTPKRSQGYLGVLVDDLTSMELLEPYRMFTSRAEYRLSLREDNADKRLSPSAYALGLLSDDQWELFQNKYNALDLLSNQLIKKFDDIFTEPTKEKVTLRDLLKRPDFSYKMLYDPRYNIEEIITHKIPTDWLEALEIQIKYEGYEKRQFLDAEKLERTLELSIPDKIEFSKVGTLSAEVIEKLLKYQPKTLGQAIKISGITPAAVSALRIYISKYSQVN